MSMDASAYKAVDTLGKSPLELVLKVYDGAISELTAARALYQDQQYSKGYNHLERAEKMVTHLYTTLDPQRGEEIAANLGKLYVWIIAKLHEVQATKEIGRFDECLKVLTNLRAGWAGIKETPDKLAPARASQETGQLEVVG